MCVHIFWWISPSLFDQNIFTNVFSNEKNKKEGNNFGYNVICDVSYRNNNKYCVYAYECASNQINLEWVYNLYYNQRKKCIFSFLVCFIFYTHIRLIQRKLNKNARAIVVHWLFLNKKKDFDMKCESYFCFLLLLFFSNFKKVNKKTTSSLCF